MPDARKLQSWVRQAWWATLVGATFIVVGYFTSAIASPDAVLVPTMFALVGQLLLFAGVVGFLVYGWSAGLGSIRR